MQWVKNNRKKKQYRWLLCIFPVLLTVIIGCLYLMYGQNTQLKEEHFVFSYDETIPNDSRSYFQYAWYKEDVVFDEALFSEIQGIGDYEVHVMFDGKMYQLPISIVDAKAPKIEFASEEITLYDVQGVLLKDETIQLEDASEVHYTISAKATDAENNKYEVCVQAKDIYENESHVCKETFVDLQKSKISYATSATSIKDIIATFVKEKQLSTETFGFFYQSMWDNEMYLYGEDSVFLAASTIKVPLNMLYYDRFQKQELTGTDTLEYLPKHTEEGGGDTLNLYHYYEQIPISFLLKQSIVNSDNTATNILVDGLGGFSSFHQQMLAYTTAEMPQAYEVENVVTIPFMFDILNRLYQYHETTYASLYEDMLEAQPNAYLKQMDVKIPIAQKYGLYGNQLHVVGIVEAQTPYLIGVYTKQRTDAYSLIQELNERILIYHSQKK